MEKPALPPSSLPGTELPADQRVKPKDDRFELLVQSVVDYAIYMLDPQGRISSWNSGAEHIKGYAAEEVLGRHFSLFYTEEDRASGVPQQVLDIAAREGRYNGEAWRIRRDGSRFRALVVIDAIRDPEGRLLGFAKVTRDVTSHWEMVSRLEESERRFRLFAEVAVEYALCMLDNDGNIRGWNESAQRVTGYESVDVLGKPFDYLLDDGVRSPGIRMELLLQARARSSHEEERRCLRRDGLNFLARITIRALTDKEGVLHGFACIIRDVSEQRATQDALENAREQLFQSQKLDALGQLTGGVAHDFNNILQAITGNLDVATLQLQRDEPGKAERQIENAMRSVERAKHLTQRLLAFARRQPLVPTTIDLNVLVASMIDLLERTVGSAIGMRVELSPSPLWVWCDAHQLEMSLVNLVINGRDAMPRGGCLRIATGHSSEEALACLAVEDNGIGMSKEMVSKAFDPFFTTKPLGQGTGLGLSMIHGFMAQSRGTVTLHSRPGEGTRVVLQFPLCDAPGPSADTSLDLASSP
jgi:PAS domain S-box-containing protein